jgi:acetoacetyl-CoA synthetase
MTAPAPDPAPDLVPDPDSVARARITDFARVASQRAGLDLTTDYASLWRWSVAELDEFWRVLWDYMGLAPRADDQPALAEEVMPGARWFPGATVSYAAQALHDRPADGVAVVAATQEGEPREVTWAELRRDVAALAATLADLGVGRGDRVVGYLPNGAEAVVALLATASLGAVWAVCGMDYAAEAAEARFGQLEPAALVAATSYTHGGRRRDRAAEVAALRAALPTLRATILLGDAGEDVAGLEGATAWTQAVDREAPFEPVLVPFDHPLWVLFSSGTTGKPKGIVHGHGGVLLEQLKTHALHFDLGPGDRLLWYTTPSWMMWNFLVGGLLVGATVVCYDGSPTVPDTGGLWSLAARLGVGTLGMSPAYIAACRKAGVDPAAGNQALVRVGVSGSTFPADSFRWLSACLGPGVQISSISGGTDVVSAFVGSAPNTPVWAGELSARYLGVALEAWDASGRPVVGEVGELVVTRPMPSMPVAFWADPDGSRYRDAYFETFPGVWRHGDWITVTERGTVVIHGRSDATLNRHGIRMGSSDIVDPVERLPEVTEAMVVGVETEDGGYWMPLFVRLAEGAVLDEPLRERIREAIRTSASPRHVPDEIIAAPGIPHTRTGKKLEVPVKRLLRGDDPSRALDRGSIDDPSLVGWYAEQGSLRRRH